MPTIHQTDQVLRTIEEHITPYLGPLMAKSSAQLHCRKLGIDSETMTADQARDLLDRLAIAMRVLVGRQKTEEVVAQLERALKLHGGSR